MTVRPVNTSFIKCDRCGTEVENTPSNTAGWIELKLSALSMVSRNIDLCNPCSGIFNRMMEKLP